MATMTGNSTDAKQSAVQGTNSAAPTPGVEGSCIGVEGQSDKGWGVYGHSKTSRGVVAVSESDYGLRASSTTSAGIRGSSVQGRGVEGWATVGEGVFGISTSGNGVSGTTDGPGVGVLGTSKGGDGIQGIAANSGTGVAGRSKTGFGVHGIADGTGVGGESTTSHGVAGFSDSTSGGAGVWGEHRGNGDGIVGISKSGTGVHGRGARRAGFFEGDVEVTGDIRLLNADCAEDFDICHASGVEPGTVMVLDNDGALSPSREAYDTRVAGVISGAGSYKPAIVLDKQESSRVRQPLALMGKVYCKADAQFGAIRVGDLLTTSQTPGHAMRIDDPAKAFGAVIGKALRPLADGQALIPILIALQ